MGFWSETRGWVVACGQETRRLSEPKVGMRTVRAVVRQVSGTGFEHAGTLRVSTVRNDAVELNLIVCHDESGGLL